MQYLSVPFFNKEQVKNLGGRWDPLKKKWYVPDNLDIKAFQQWLPSSSPKEQLPLAYAPKTNNHKQNKFEYSDIFQSKTSNIETTINSDANVQISTIETHATEARLELSEFLERIKSTIQHNFSNAQWIIAEIASLQDRGHIYIELVQNDTLGKELAKCRAIIWKNNASLINQSFKLTTGENLRSGIKILFKGKANFHPQYGFSITIDAINPNFTLGDIEQKLIQIRNELIVKNLYYKNSQLTQVKFFTRIAVISPPQAAGLGDFKIEADVLKKYRLCEFDYFPTTFQGENVQSEFQKSFDNIYRTHSSTPYSAVVIIRGGGAITDLLYLNDIQIATMVCNCTIPVYSGIGHERDNTIIDEVAAQRFDTPSKVIQFILQSIVNQTQHAQQNWNYINACISDLINKNQLALLQLINTIEQNSNTKQNLATITNHLALIARLSQKKLLNEQHSLSVLYQDCLKNAHNKCNILKIKLDNLVAQVQVTTTIKQHRLTINNLITQVLNRHPQQTLQQGYSISRTTDGKIVANKKTATTQNELIIEYHDGKITVSYNKDNP